eukprot:TRINITY_DN4548_c0_g1_i1.p1 TRINITY_DN4548_c0_g1~~TRINITY_DN4548_c0_g1_i1.p1  ORF type:complete len:144 (+),score=28.46 TRINITY_DN4548_c0_g1_i1:84-515(+)
MSLLFVLHSALEILSGLVFFFFPRLVFPNINEAGKEPARWWAGSIIGLGLATWTVRNLPNEDRAKRGIGLAAATYHLIMVVIFIRKLFVLFFAPSASRSTSLPTLLADDKMKSVSGLFTHLLIFVSFVVSLSLDVATFCSLLQ